MTCPNCREDRTDGLTCCGAGTPVAAAGAAVVLKLVGVAGFAAEAATFGGAAVATGGAAVVVAGAYLVVSSLFCSHK